MGRPLNKKFFGDGAGLLEVECFTVRAGASTAGYIVRQRSNLVYEIADETLNDVDVDNLAIGSLYEIAVVGTTDFTTAGAASNTVGVRFYATIALATGSGTAREIVFGQLQEAAVTLAGQARLVVTPENAQTPAEATFTFSTNGGGNVSAVTVTDGGYGYWTPNATFNITVASDAGYVAGTESVVTLTVANGSVVSASFTAGAGYSASITNDPIVAADVLDEDAAPPVQFARIINSKRVKCFPRLGGNTYAWPLTTPVDTGRGGFSEATLELQ